nr:dUTPase [uncultured bacterium]
MVVSIAEILERKIIGNRDFGEGEGLVEPEGAAIDIRIGEIWEMLPETEAFLKKKTRKSREYKKVAEFIPGQDDSFTLQPNIYYQLTSVEDFTMPADLVGRFIGRYNLLVNGIMILGYKMDPGYKGKISVPIVNLSGVPFELELGCRYSQSEFHRIDGESVKYRGQWGTRTFIAEEEIQV